MDCARILIVDDHELFREGVVKAINRQPDMEIIGQADDGLEALTKANELRPDLILMDINMPLSGGLEATALIHSMMPETLIVMLTAYEEEEKLFRALKAGAGGYILKSSSSAGLIRGIRGALGGEATVPRKLASRLLTEFSRLARIPDNLKNEDIASLLTNREREILDMMASGSSNQDIADRLSISQQTVKGHVGSILTKLHVKSRHEAAEFGIRQGIIQRRS